MNNQDDALHQRQFLREKGIEKDREGGDGEDQEGPVPSFENIIRIIEDQQALDLGASQEGGISSPRLPSENAQPTLLIGQSDWPLTHQPVTADILTYR